jgi:Ca2+-binding RTX toxin-like protein
LVVLIFIGISGAMSAANSVPSTSLGRSVLSVTANTLKPAACTMTLTNIVFCSGSGTCQGTGANNLILGTTGNDTIKAGGGADCIIAGGGNDTVNAGSGADICIEGPGTDTYNSCTVVNP